MGVKVSRGCIDSIQYVSVQHIYLYVYIYIHIYTKYIKGYTIYGLIYTRYVCIYVNTYLFVNIQQIPGGGPGRPGPARRRLGLPSIFIKMLHLRLLSFRM